MRKIKKVAVIGSGIMGSGIACHFANIGVEVLLFDISPKELKPEWISQNLSLDHPKLKYAIVNENLQKAVKSNPSPIFDDSVLQRISTHSIDYDLDKIKNCDWTIEVIVEKLDVKQSLFEKIDAIRKPGTLISSNTSGIPIHLMTEGRSDDFKKHFCGTHFFNPARYLKLFEVIPTAYSSPEVIDFYMNYGTHFLGKTAVLCKDTPAFIGNRIGIFGMMHTLQKFQSLGLSLTDIDKLTGPIIGRPKSATFRTADLVGLDTLAHVANGLAQSVKHDEQINSFILPDYLQKMIQNNWLGDKTKQGFYKKTVDEKGSKIILELNLQNFEYQAATKSVFPALELAKNTSNLADRYKILIQAKDKAGDFYRESFAALFAYAANRIPEISDDYYKIDDAMKGGFGWQQGPFEIWDAIGLDAGIELIQQQGYTPAQWILDLQTNGYKNFYCLNHATGHKQYFNLKNQSFETIPGQENFIILDNIRNTKTIWQNAGGNIIDLGDGILNIEFRSKMNTIGAEVLQLINKGIDLAEKDYRGIVIANEGENFSVGANLMMLFSLAIEQEYDELNFAIKTFQDTMMRLRYSAIPTIAAPHAMTFGGGCELCLHTDAVVAYAETYIGLVEFGVGVIPAGGGSKELTLRALEHSLKGDVETNRVQEYFLNIAMAKVATSARNAFQLGIFKEGRDQVVLNKNNQIQLAKKHALLLADNAYTQPVSKPVKVLGKQLLGILKVGIDAMQDGGYITEHENKIAQKLAYVMAGGDLSEATYVSEQYLLQLEREAFLSLLTEKKTLERIQHMLKTGKPLRN